MNENITATITLFRKRYYNELNNFGIISANVLTSENELITDKYGRIILKGIMPKPQG